MLNLKSISKVSIPLDGSDLASSALPWATLISSAARASVHLVGVLESEENQENRDLLLDYLERTESELEKRTSKVSIHTLEGNAPKEIAEQARIEKSDLIVMASHSRTGVLTRLLGSVSFWVLRFTTVPVMIVKPESGDATVRKILYPVDGSTPSEEGLSLAAGLSSILTIPLYLFHVTESGYKAPKHVECSMSALRELGTEVELIVRQGNPKERITELVNSESGILTVLGSETATGIDVVKMGSVAEHLFANTIMPTIVVPKKPYPRY
jgi:nucleotide-binding universal stress UspA family protein